MTIDSSTEIEYRIVKVLCHTHYHVQQRPGGKNQILYKDGWGDLLGTYLYLTKWGARHKIRQVKRRRASGEVSYDPYAVKVVWP